MKKNKLISAALVYADTVRETQAARRGLKFARNNEVGGNDEEHDAAGRLLDALEAQDMAAIALAQAQAFA